MWDQLWIAVQITGVGMGLVFASILLLWGVMALLVRLTPEKEAVETAEAEAAARAEAAAAEAAAAEAAELALKQQAAAVAVAYALAVQAAKAEEPFVPEFPLPQTALVSAWQAVMRTNMLHKRGTVR